MNLTEKRVEEVQLTELASYFSNLHFSSHKGLVYRAHAPQTHVDELPQNDHHHARWGSSCRKYVTYQAVPLLYKFKRHLQALG